MSHIDVEKMGKTKILIVEDEGIVAKDIKGMLLGLGYEVSAIVSSRKEAIDKAEELRPDLVLMDIMLQREMGGIQAAEVIYNKLNIPVIYVTAYADENTLKQAMKTEPFGYMLKPFNERELQTSIETALFKFKMETKLKEREQWLSTILRSIGDAVIATDDTGKITFMNSLAEGITAWKQKDAMGISLQDVFSIMDEKTGRAFKFSLKTVAAKENIGMFKEAILRRKDGSETPVDYVFSPIMDERKNYYGLVLVFRDISERKQAEEQLKQSREQLRDLTAYLQSIREEERTAIAREVHDELGQALTALKMDISWLSHRLPENAETLLKKTKSMSRLTDMTIQTVKKISSELRPGLLDDLGLTAAIEWQAGEFEEHTGIRCHVAFDPEEILADGERSTALFRIFQETLTNVARHSGASEVHASLKEKDERLVLKIRDNGKGITKKQATDPKSLGLVGIKERAHSLGGEVKFIGIQDKGTSVTVEIPINDKGRIK